LPTPQTHRHSSEPTRLPLKGGVWDILVGILGHLEAQLPAEDTVHQLLEAVLHVLCSDTEASVKSVCQSVNRPDSDLLLLPIYGRSGSGPGRERP